MAWSHTKSVRGIVAVVLSVVAIGGCGGHKPPGVSTTPARVNLSPAGSASIQLGAVLAFVASAENSNNNTVGAVFTYLSSDTSILNIAPNGIACAGRWDATYSNCTPGNTGVVTVTATTVGATSVPTYVFVHPLIDNISVTGVLLNGVAVQEPCLSQSQSMTVEAHAFSRGSDVTASVGPFNWTSNNPAVARVTPLVNIAYNFPTNQATAVAVTPGITQIYALASGVTSTSFSQPPPGTNLGFFETCPIQNIALELGHAGSGQTSFVSAKGAALSEAVVATLTDVMGNSSLPNTNGDIVLSRIPLTWTSSQPQVLGPGSGCLQTCSLSLPAAGSAAVTASCSPPTCNVGFPLAPPGSIVPVPVYATTAISGLVTGSGSSTAVLATSLGCEKLPPVDCATAIYNVSTTKATAGTATPMPVSPNSLLFDLAGDRAYVGSDFGAQVLNPGNLGSTANPFTPIGTVTGKVLAISTNGSSAILSDTLHVPNQVYVVTTVGTNASSVALDISGASAAAFSRDGLKAFIFGFDSNGDPNLYIYSTLRALQTVPLQAGTTVNDITFSTNNAFAYVVEPSLAGGGPAFTVYNTCDNQISTSPAPILTPQTIPLTAIPIAFKVLPDGEHFIALEEGGAIDYISATITGIPAATLSAPSNLLCPMTVTHTKKTINLAQGVIHPIDFFPSADGTQLYVLASDRSSVLVYNFASGAVTGVELAGNATPVSVDMSVDGGTLVVAGSDGLLHQVTFASGGSDQVQVSFPNLANYLNPFCTYSPSGGDCTLDFIAAKP